MQLLTSKPAPALPRLAGPAQKKPAMKSPHEPTADRRPDRQGCVTQLLQASLDDTQTCRQDSLLHNLSEQHRVQPTYRRGGDRTSHWRKLASDQATQTDFPKTYMPTCWLSQQLNSRSPAFQGEFQYS